MCLSLKSSLQPLYTVFVCLLELAHAHLHPTSRVPKQPVQTTCVLKNQPVQNNLCKTTCAKQPVQNNLCKQPVQNNLCKQPVQTTCAKQHVYQRTAPPERKQQVPNNIFHPGPYNIYFILVHTTYSILVHTTYFILVHTTHFILVQTTCFILVHTTGPSMRLQQLHTLPLSSSSRTYGVQRCVALPYSLARCKHDLKRWQYAFYPHNSCKKKGLQEEEKRTSSGHNSYKKEGSAPLLATILTRSREVHL